MNRALVPLLRNARSHVARGYQNNRSTTNSITRCSAVRPGTSSNSTSTTRCSSSAQSGSDTLGGPEALLAHVRARVSVLGPLTVADYMRELLTNPMGGYYTRGASAPPMVATHHESAAGAVPQPADNVNNSNAAVTTQSQAARERVGVTNAAATRADEATNTTPNHASTAHSAAARAPAGDYVTSPELSQMFGELVGVWLLSEWIRHGRPDRVRLLELGPGSGALMADVLRVLRRLQGPRELRIVLVEAGVGLSARQEATLCAVPLSEVDTGAIRETGVDGAYREATTADGVSIAWYRHLEAVPQAESDMATLAVAHEFFDALPAHQLVRMKDGSWRERLIDAPPGPNEAGGEGSEAAAAEAMEEQEHGQRKEKGNEQGTIATEGSMLASQTAQVVQTPDVVQLADQGTPDTTMDGERVAPTPTSASTSTSMSTSTPQTTQTPQSLRFVLAPESTAAVEQMEAIPQLLPVTPPSEGDVLEVSFDALRAMRQLTAQLASGAGGTCGKQGRDEERE